MLWQILSNKVSYLGTYACLQPILMSFLCHVYSSFRNSKSLCHHDDDCNNEIRFQAHHLKFWNRHRKSKQRRSNMLPKELKIISSYLCFNQFSFLKEYHILFSIKLISSILECIGIFRQLYLFCINMIDGLITPFNQIICQWKMMHRQGSFCHEIYKILHRYYIDFQYRNR